MASDWIKMEHTTIGKPELAHMSSILKTHEDHVLVGLVRVWIWADEICVAGEPLTVTEGFLDGVARRRGFAAAMRKVGWLEGENGALRFPNFTRHNGKSAKKRAVDMERKRMERNGHASVRDLSAPGATDTGRKTDKSATRERDRVYTDTPTPTGDDHPSDLKLEGQDAPGPPKVDPLLARARALFVKNPRTPLDAGELRAWDRREGSAKKVLAAASEEDWRLLEWWFGADKALIPDAKFRRQRLVTLLANWNGEVLRARAVAEKHGLDFGKKRKAAFPEDWKERIELAFPEANLPPEFHQLEPSMQAWVLEDWRRNL